MELSSTCFDIYLANQLICQNNWEMAISEKLNFTMPHYRAEILTILGSYFGRNYDFIHNELPRFYLVFKGNFSVGHGTCMNDMSFFGGHSIHGLPTYSKIGYHLCTYYLYKNNGFKGTNT